MNNIFRKIKNFRDNFKLYGPLGVLRFYFKNVVFGEQVEFNSHLLIKALIKNRVMAIKKLFDTMYKKF